MRSVRAAICCLVAALALSGPGDTVFVGERWF
jgi:hypothetical protein